MEQLTDVSEPVKCCDLFPGALRNRITIQREVEASDGAGGNTLSWKNYAEIRAFIKPVSGNERLQAMRLEANITHRIYIRYRSDLRTDDRVNYQGRLMQIRALINIEERNKWLEIYAQEGVAT